MSKKQLQNRLESLFAGLDQDSSLLSAGEQALPGWTWETDASGIFRSCSPEVADHLGFQPGELVGNQLAEFALSQVEARKIRRALLSGNSPLEIELQYSTSSSGSLAVTMRIFRTLAQDGNETGWRGMCLVHQAHPAARSEPARTEKTPKQTRKPGQSSQKPIPAPGWPGSKPAPGEALGVLVEDSRVQPAGSSLTSAGLESLRRSRPVVKHAQKDDPSAILAVTKPVQDQHNLLLEIMDEDPNRQWSEDELLLVEQVADQLSLALENASLFNQTELALAETETLYSASAELNSAGSYDDILFTLRKYTILGQGSRHVSIHLFDQDWTSNQAPEWLAPVAAWDLESPAISSSQRISLGSLPGLAGILRPDRPILILQVNQDTRLDEITRSYLQHRFACESLLFVPLLVTGRWIGLTLAAYLQSLSVPEADIRRLTTLASQAAVAIQTFRLLEESRRRADQLQTAAEIARDTSSTLALDNLLQRTVNLLRSRFAYSRASVYLLDESGENAVVVGFAGPDAEEMGQGSQKLAVGSQSAIGYVTQHGAPLVLNVMPQAPDRRLNPLHPDTRAELAIPLKIGERILGALDVQSEQANAFTADDISVLQVLSDQIAIAVENARSYELSQQAVSEMRELDRLKSQFLANMSHELRTPLNSIIGFSRVILKGIDGPVNDIQQQDITAIYNSGQHLLRLINDILDLSKIEAGKMELAFEEQVNMNELISSVMLTVSGLVKDKPVEILQHVQADLPPVRADPVKIRQVLINLLSNAAKFTERGSITLLAQVRTSSSGKPEMLVSVEDTGPGIAPQDQEKLFQPFSQVDGSLTRKTGGTGLGLSISRHLVEMHAGRIGLESQPGKGSRFFFTLPLPPAEQEAASSQTGLERNFSIGDSSL